MDEITNEEKGKIQMLFKSVRGVYFFTISAYAEKLGYKNAAKRDSVENTESIRSLGADNTIDIKFIEEIKLEGFELILGYYVSDENDYRIEQQKMTIKFITGNFEKLLEPSDVIKKLETVVEKINKSKSLKERFECLNENFLYYKYDKFEEYPFEDYLKAVFHE